MPLLHPTNRFVLLLVLSGAIVSLSPARAAAQTNAPVIELTIDPPKLVLGRTPHAEVTAVIKGVESHRSADIHIDFAVNTGELTEHQQITPTTVKARYIPPTDYFPQYAIVSAKAQVGDQTVRNWIVVPLWGVGEVTVKSLPLSMVTLKVGDESFGPFKANRRGRVKIPIVVPPGIRTGTVGKQVIDLKVPRFNRIAVLPEQRTLVAGDRERTRIYFYIVDETGRPVPDARLDIRANRGSLSSVREINRGVYMSEFLPPDEIGNGTASVVAQLEDDDASQRTIAFSIGSGAPAEVDIQLTPEEFVAGTAEPIELSFRVTDTQGHPTRAELDIQTDIGRLGTAQLVEQGHYRTTLTLPDSFAGRNRATLTIATGPENQPVHRQVSIPLRPSAPASVQISTLSQPVAGDGRTTVYIPVAVQDEFGNPVTRPVLAASCTSGAVPDRIEATDGQYVIPFTPPKVDGPEHAELTVKIDEVVSSMAIELIRPGYRLAITPQVGYLTNFSRLHSPLFLAEADVGLFDLLPGLHVYIDAGYYFSKKELNTVDARAALYALPLSGLVGYQLAINSRLSLTGAVGAGAVFLWNRTTITDGATIADRATVFAFPAMVGVNYKLGPGALTARIRYLYAKATDIEELQGQIGGVALIVGYRYALL